MKFFLTVLVHLVGWLVIYGIFSIFGWEIPDSWPAITIFIVGGIVFTITDSIGDA